MKRCKMLRRGTAVGFQNHESAQEESNLVQTDLSDGDSFTAFLVDIHESGKQNLVSSVRSSDSHFTAAPNLGALKLPDIIHICADM
jgi:hypothetical protein